MLRWEAFISSDFFLKYLHLRSNPAPSLASSAGFAHLLLQPARSLHRTMTYRTFAPLFLLTVASALNSSARAASAPATPEGGEIKSLVERLRHEREAQLDKSKASPLGAWSTRESERRARKYLGRAISSSIASERQAANVSSLPAALALSGDRALSVSEEAQVPGARSAQKWRVNLDVPMTHFWGKATLSAGFERSQAGASREAEAASSGLQQNATVSLRQDIKKGALSGTAQVAISGDDSRQDELPGAAERDRKAKAEGSARLKLQLSQGLAITGSHQSRLERAASLQPGEAGATEAGATSQSSATSDALAQLGERQARWDVERQASRRSNSELGLEWKWSKSLALSAGASTARSGQEAGAQTPIASAGVWVPQWLRDESRANLALQRRTGGGSWGLNWSRAWAQQGSAQDAASQPAMQRSEDKRSDAISLQAERKLAGWLSMRGSWKLAGETNYLASRLSDQATREAEARINGGLGSLALRYSDWSSQSSAASGDALSAGGRREYGVRYEAGREAGLGLAVEYSVRDEKAASAASNWKLGVTYR